MVDGQSASNIQPQFDCSLDSAGSHIISIAVVTGLRLPTKMASAPVQSHLRHLTDFQEITNRGAGGSSHRPSMRQVSDGLASIPKERVKLRVSRESHSTLIL